MSPDSNIQKYSCCTVALTRHGTAGPDFEAGTNCVSEASDVPSFELLALRTSTLILRAVCGHFEATLRPSLITDDREK